MHMHDYKRGGEGAASESERDNEVCNLSFRATQNERAMSLLIDTQQVRVRERESERETLQVRNLSSEVFFKM